MCETSKYLDCDSSVSILSDLYLMALGRSLPRACVIINVRRNAKCTVAS